MTSEDLSIRTDTEFISFAIDSSRLTLNLTLITASDRIVEGAVLARNDSHVIGVDFKVYDIIRRI